MSKRYAQHKAVEVVTGLVASQHSSLYLYRKQTVIADRVYIQ